MIKNYPLLIILFLVTAFGLPLISKAEGTKQLEPTVLDFTKVRINKTLAYNNFGNYNSDPHERLCIRIGSTTEKICFGTGDWGGGQMNLKIRDPQDFLVFGPFSLSNTPGDSGFIRTYNEAIAGPNIVNAAGYIPLIFHPTTTGDYYFEFDFSGNPNRDFKYFDITVVNAANNPINGRVWSESWQLSAGQFHTEPGSRSTMYIYSADSVVTSIYFNGLKAEGTEMYANDYGVLPPPFPLVQGRLSRPGRWEAPKFKVFLNNPDPVQFPSGIIGSILPGSLNIIPDCSGSLLVYYDVAKPGLVEVFIELNPLPGQQPEDILTYDTVTAGTNLLIWNGYDGLGNKVANGTPVSVRLAYLNGFTNFLMYDALTNLNGFITSVVRPGGLTARLNWNDTLLPNGTYSLVPCSSSMPAPGCHTWDGTTNSGTGNDNTINTWWYATDVAPYTGVALYGIDTTYNFPVPLCVGDTVILQGVPITQPGDYVFNYPSALTGCDSTLIYHVTFLPTPVVNLGPDVIVCTGVSRSFDAGAGAGYTYRWDNLSTGTLGISTQQIFTTTTPGTYKVTVLNPIGCDDADTIVFSNYPVPHVTNTPLSKAICNATSTNIILTSDVPGTTFTWTTTASSSNVTGYSNSLAPGLLINQILVNSGNTDEWVIYHITPSANGCSGVPADFTVTVRPVAIVTTTPVNRMICSGAGASIVLTSNVANATFSWTPTPSSPMVSGYSSGSGNYIGDVLVNASNLMQSVVYHIIPTTNGCAGIPADLTVSINAVPNVTIQPPAQSICSGQTTNVQFQSTTPGTVFSWTPAAIIGAPQVTGQTSGSGNVLVQTLYTAGTAPGSITYLVQPSVNGCPGIPGYVDVTVNPVLPASFQMCFDNPTQENAQPIRLRGGIPLNGTFSGPGVAAGYFYPGIAGPGTHLITYTYTNVYGCPSQASQSVQVFAAPTNFTCGDVFRDVRDNKQYPTVAIGSQCWMAANLDYGNYILGSSMQRDNCIPEKYCYQDNMNNCNSSGALYQWDELMRYEDFQGLQGMCPPGWHIPSESEWNTLLLVYNGPAYAGASLKATGTSGYNATFPGQRFMNRVYGFKTFATHFWSSTSHSAFKAWAHAMNRYDPSVAWYPAARSNAFPVRCVKD